MVSVIIPAYNRATAVRRAVGSVLVQTFQDFEIIVVDDGSTDATAAAVTSFGDDRIRLIRHDRNRGGSAARNTGVRASSGEYVAFLDSDDEWLPAKLERQLHVFRRGGDRLGLVYTGAERIHPDGSVSRDRARRYDDLATALLTVNVVGETSVGMVRRSVFDEVGGFDEELPSSQDLDLWLRISERSRADLVPDPLVRVFKGNDRGRIAANVTATISGRERFCRKHGHKMRQQGVLHRYLRSSGWVFQREARDPLGARRMYLKSLSVRPLAPATYALLVATYLPMPLLDQVARWTHRTFRLLDDRGASGTRGIGSAPGPPPAREQRAR